MFRVCYFYPDRDIEEYFLPVLRLHLENQGARHELRLIQDDLVLRGYTELVASDEKAAQATEQLLAELISVYNEHAKFEG